MNTVSGIHRCELASSAPALRAVMPAVGVAVFLLVSCRVAGADDANGSALPPAAPAAEPAASEAPPPVVSAPENPSDPHLPGFACRAFRTKRHDVPVYREADRRSEVLAKLTRSTEVCGLAETRDFVTILWQPKTGELGAGVPAPTPPPPGDTPHAYIRTVDLWPPRNEPSGGRTAVKDWWTFHQQGGVPDDPLFWLRPLISFFGFSQQNTPPHVP